MKTDEPLIALNNINIPSSAYHEPSFELTSQLTNLPSLSDYEVDENINFDINSQYCAVQNLSSLKAPNKDLSLFHMNIRSLPLHHDEFYTLIANLSVDFHGIENQH